MRKVSIDRYSVEELLSKGAFGEVYSAIDNIESINVAVKLEDSDKSSYIPIEAHIYRLLENQEGFLKFYKFGFNQTINYIILQHIQLNLYQFVAQQGVISEQNIKSIAVNLIKSLQHLHSKGFIHRDVKPQNILIQDDKCYLIDFGLATKYKTCGEQIIKQKNKHAKFVGTAIYASINVHCGFLAQRRDDLESLCYVLVFIMKGRLPWQDLPINGDDDKFYYIKEKKMEMTIDEITKGTVNGITDFLRYCRQLEQYKTPDYDLILSFFQ